MCGCLDDLSEIASQRVWLMAGWMALSGTGRAGSHRYMEVCSSGVRIISN